MIKMAKKKGSGNAPFYVAVRRCLSNPFTPPVYIEGRKGGMADADETKEAVQTPRMSEADRRTVLRGT